MAILNKEFEIRTDDNEPVFVGSERAFAFETFAADGTTPVAATNYELKIFDPDNNTQDTPDNTYTNGDMTITANKAVMKYTFTKAGTYRGEWKVSGNMKQTSTVFVEVIAPT